MVSLRPMGLTDPVVDDVRDTFVVADGVTLGVDVSDCSLLRLTVSEKESVGDSVTCEEKDSDQVASNEGETLCDA